MVDVYTGRLKPAFFWVAGTCKRMGRSALAPGISVYCFCGRRRIYHGDYREQMDALGCMGLFGPAAAAYGADLCTFFNFIFRLVRRRNPDVRISAALDI